MSGDLQARKRRDKKKRREDGPELLAQPSPAPQQQTPVSNITDDSNIHVHKEVSTGGGLCAKFIFFILLSLLTALIGLTITEYRGLTDIETINSDSYFAQLFEGWIDKPSLSHELEEDEEISLEHSEDHVEDSHEQSLSEEDEEEEEEEEQDYYEETEESNVEEEEEESEGSYTREETVEDETMEVDSVTQEETTETDSVTQEETAENDESAIQDETTENDESAIQDETTENDESAIQDETMENDESAIQDETDESTIQDETVETNESTIQDETTENEETEESNVQEETLEKDESSEPDISNENNSDDEVADEKNEATTETFQDKVSESKEAVNSKEQKSSEDIADSQEEAKNEDAQVLENLSTEKVPSLDENENVIDDATLNLDQAENQENTNLVVKFGVGTALLVVAYVVLIKKWKTDEGLDAKLDVLEAEDVLLDLSRRNTLVSPPNFEEVERDIVKTEEEYSEEEDYDSEIEEKQESSNVKMHYAELQSKYDTNTLSPYWQTKEVRENPQNDEYDDDEEEYDDEEVEEEEENIEYEEEEQEEEYENSNEEGSENENENEELLQRLEAKYGKINRSDDEEYDYEEREGDGDDDEDFESWKRVPEDSDSGDDGKSTQRSGGQSFFDFSFLTNSDDLKIQEELDNASQNLNNDAAYALTLFNKILEKNPFSPRALYGKAKALDTLAEQKKSNNLLQQAILGYQEVLKVPNVLDSLYMLAAERCIDRMRFRGLHQQAVSIHKSLIDKFPDDVSFRNNLAVTYLTFNRVKEAQNLLNETLSKWPKNGYALVHYGFILKTTLNDLPQAVKYLEQGISTNEAGVIDGRFFFHLGDALTRLGRKEEALKVYEKGVTFKLFLSKFQRSLYNVESLTGKPWWKKEEIKHTKFLNELENNWEVIRKEGLSILNRDGYFLPEVENLRDVGDWKQFELYARGVKNVKNCKQCPKTCKIIETLPDAMGCKRGQVKFSVMHPGTHVWPHCGPTNCRLRIHLGLKVPSNTYIRVGEEIRSWKEGKVLIFDDSFEHEVWHNGTITRLVLIVDIWHPELTMAEKRKLSPI